MGAKQSSQQRTRAYSNVGQPGEAVTTNGAELAVPGTSSGLYPRTRARSLGSAHNSSQNANGENNADSPSESSTPENTPLAMPLTYGGRLMPSSLPVQLFAYHTSIKCPICNKPIPQDEIDVHLIMCLTKPRINYNEDVLRENQGECVICFDDLSQGDTIARLPCLCIYHKHCIDDWFKRSRSCPGHPND